MPRLICIVGPTASGKTALSIALAKLLDGEIVSCDSMQLYRYMDIGTAKPTLLERDGIVHHMLDVLDPAEPFSVGQYVRDADHCVQDVLSREKTCLIVGGTGLYVDSLIAGREFAPSPETGKRGALEAEADRLGMEEMLARLQEVDPKTAEKLHAKDRKRILRALEVYEETGEPMSTHNERINAAPPRYQPCWIGLAYERREDLYARIDLRVEQMLQDGLLEEIEKLQRMGIPESSTAMQAIGYKEFLPVLSGEIALDEAKKAVQQASRRYAKRQLTWFRRNPKIRWISMQPGMDFPAVLSEAQQILSDFDRTTSI